MDIFSVLVPEEVLKEAVPIAEIAEVIVQTYKIDSFMGLVPENF